MRDKEIIEAVVKYEDLPENTFHWTGSNTRIFELLKALKDFCKGEKKCGCRYATNTAHFPTVRVNQSRKIIEIKKKHGNGVDIKTLTGYTYKCKDCGETHIVPPLNKKQKGEEKYIPYSELKKVLE